MEDFKDFLSAFFGAAAIWIALMSGIVSLLIALWLRLRHRTDVSNRTFWRIGLFCVFAAFYLLWRDEHHKVKDLDRQLRLAHQTRESFQATMRAYVNLGKPDGTLMQWRSLEPGHPGVIEIYFHNTGNTEAREFWVNREVSFPNIRGLRAYFPRHIRPKPTPRPDGSTLMLMTRTIPGHSDVQRELAYTESPLSEDIITSIKSGNIHVIVTGTFEYVDIFDSYCCKNFAAIWRGEIGEFSPQPRFRDNCPASIPSHCHD